MDDIFESLKAEKKEDDGKASIVLFVSV